MYQFSNILFCPLTDLGNPAAVRRVTDLAEREGAKVTLFGSVRAPSLFERILHGEEYEQRVQTAAIADREGLLARWVPEDSGDSVATAVDVGDPATSIVKRVVRDRHDLVVVTSDEDRADRTTIKRLLRQCPCPVWVIRPTRAKTQRVLAAVNPAEDEADLNREILEIAASMTELYGGELHVCHAWELYGEETMRLSPFLEVNSGDVDERLAKGEAAHSAAMAALLDQPGIRDAPWEVHVYKGPTAPMVEAAVDALRINVLVMGTIARTGLPGLVMGNTAETLVDDVKCSVIAVKPPHFLTNLIGLS